MAEAVLRAELVRCRVHHRYRVDSAGTHATQPGHRADARAVRICRQWGVDLGRSRARQVREGDFQRHDYILAVDDKCFQWLRAAAAENSAARISRLGAWAPQGDLGDIPDPYFGNAASFELVFDMLHRAIPGFVAHLLQNSR